MQRHRTPTYIRDEGFVDRKPGAGVDDFISWITIGLLAQTDGRLGPGKDHDAIGGGTDPTCFTKMFGDGNAEGKNPLGVTVVSIVLVDLPLDLFLDKLGNRKIRLAEIALDHLFSLFFDGPDVRPDLEGILRIHPSNAL